MGCAGSCALGGQTAGHTRRTMHLTEAAGSERHVFQEKVLRKKRLCAACSEPVVSQGSVCRVCKITSHKKCEGKVPPGCCSPPSADMRRRTAPGPSIQHMGSTKSLNLKQRSSLPRSFSLDHVIQRSYDLDLTYITERIISVFFPTVLEEQRYRSNLREVAAMLRSKHEDKYLLFNLSKKRHDITRLNPKVQDFFWPDCHAPPLDVICSICKAMEAWLSTDAQHVVVLHCKGNQGKTGVVIASYMHYSKVSASVDQALSTLAMRKFCEDKVSVSLHPSQRRYINYFGGLLSGTIKISSNMLSLQCVLLPVVPALQTDGGFCPFLKIYQSMQLVYTSGIYRTLGDTNPQRRQLCISLEPALLLKGDIMVKCYHKRCQPHEREVLFRLQFHTCTIHNTHLCFSKDQLDCACTDEKFPEDATVEFIFSSGSEKVKGREVLRKDPGVSVDYDITDPLIRFDSYENLNRNHEDSLDNLSHTRGPLDGSLYARVKKSIPLTSSNGSPEQHGRLLSVSSDSGHSSAPTEKLEETPQKSLPTAAEREDLERLLGGFGVTVKQEGEPRYSQVPKHEEGGPQNGNQRLNVEGRPQDPQHRLLRERITQNIQTKMNGEAGSQYASSWQRVPEGGTSQCVPLASSSWEVQRETPSGTNWEGQREREAAILEEEIGQFGGLAVYPVRRPLLSRHCSCRLGYAGPNIDGPPNRSYFRPEGILDSRGASGTGTVLQAAHFPGMYGEQERRRLYRSLSEGPQHYPTQAQSPPKRGSLRDTHPFLCHAPPAPEPLLHPLCPCSHCQSSVCYSLPNMWPVEGGKMPPVQPFHRGELPLHMSQSYGQSVRPNHDIPPPFQIPQAKIHYGYPTPHGEETLHFNHFTEGGYGHAYPHFLHPSYLPTHCPPNGYDAHSFSTYVPPYSPTGGHSPPSGSVSPIVPSNNAPRRMSGDTMSAGSAGDLTPPQQELRDNVTQGAAPSFQPQKHKEPAPAISTSAIVHANSIVHAQSPLHTSTPANTYSQVHTTNPAHTHVQTDAPKYPQSPEHRSTSPHTHSQSVQTQSFVHTCYPSPTQCPSVQTDSTAHRRGLSGQFYNSVHTQSPTVQAHRSVHTHDPHVQIHGPVHTQSPTIQTYSHVQSQSSPVHAHSPVHTQNTTVQTHNLVRTPDPPVQTHSPVHTQTPTMHTQSSPVHSQTPVHAQSTSIQTHNLVRTPDPPVQTHSPVHTQSPKVQTQSPPAQNLSSPHTSIQSHSPVCTDNLSAQTPSPVHTQNPSVQTYNSVQIHNAMHTQNVSVQTHRSIGNQGPSVQNHKSLPTSNPVNERSGFTLSQVDIAHKTTPDNSVMLSVAPSYATHVSPQLAVTPEARSLEATRGHSTFGPNICASTPIPAPPPPPTQYSVAMGAEPAHCAHLPPLPENSATLQKKSTTFSLPTASITCIGGEAPTCPQLSPIGNQSELLPPSPTPSFPISTAYYTGSPCPPNVQPPRLPDKLHPRAGRERAGNLGHPNGHSEINKPPASPTGVLQDPPQMGNFLQDSSKFWYKPSISREQAIALLRSAEPGSFLIRDSNSFRGAYGLALKVSCPPPSIISQTCKGDPAEQLVRHFLIETGPKGVKIKGSPVEPHFGSLSALVSQHSVTPLSLPCRLHIPCRDLTEQSSEVSVPTNMSTAADLLREGAACSVLYLGSVDTESLTGPQAISKASSAILTPPRSIATMVHFKVSDQGITLTDSQRRLFFRRHYPVSSVTFCSADPQDRRWTNPDRTTSKVFGFVARKAGSTAENVCHLFAELDPEQPASAIVNFVTKVMLGTQRR
ncbi:tensin-2 isoform X1 [Ascaphus truei]|uniref:tensin-2 isoform X1 n=1 Tax=Ascaphus truei TaxID=8439 RepID=UPI003F59FEE4